MRKIDYVYYILLLIVLGLLVGWIYKDSEIVKDRDSQIFDLESNLTECEKQLPTQTICFNPLNCVADQDLLGCRKIVNNWCCCKDIVVDNEIVIRPKEFYNCVCTKNLYEFIEIDWNE